MITIGMTEKIAEMAKIKLNDEELHKAQQELCRMAEFAQQISEAASQLGAEEESVQEIQRNGDRLSCEININDLSENSMHMKDGFFRIEAGERK